MRNLKNKRIAFVGAVLCAAMMLAGGSVSRAQQGGFTPPPQTMQGQGGSVLEVPVSPSGQGGSSKDNVPQFAPQGSALELPSRALRSQSGYQQFTITVTDQRGRYVTGLQKGDFRIYVDGIQRPLEFLRRDASTPVSVGILVDTSGSMDPKIPQARAAIAEFIRDLNPNDDLF